MIWGNARYVMRSSRSSPDAEDSDSDSHSSVSRSQAQSLSGGIERAAKLGSIPGLGSVTGRESAGRSEEKEKILIFCNKSSKVDELGSWLDERGIKNVALTSASAKRVWGSNKHLEGFLKDPSSMASESDSDSGSPSTNESSSSSASSASSSESLSAADVDDAGGTLLTSSSTFSSSAPPCPPSSSSKSKPKSKSSHSSSSPSPSILITTSLLSRGLDFAPTLRTIFILDQPRNMIDFIHRAGRTGRAGNMGCRVLVFGRGRGRGSLGVKEGRRKIRALV